MDLQTAVRKAVVVGQAALVVFAGASLESAAATEIRAAQRTVAIAEAIGAGRIEATVLDLGDHVRDQMRREIERK